MSLPRFLSSLGALPAHGSLSNIGTREHADVADAVMEIAPDWSVELCGVTLDDRCVVVMPEDGDDMTGPTYIIRRSGSLVVLEEMRWDECHVIAACGDLHDAIRHLSAGLRMAESQVAVASRLRH